MYWQVSVNFKSNQNHSKSNFDLAIFNRQFTGNAWTILQLHNNTTCIMQRLFILQNKFQFISFNLHSAAKNWKIVRVVPRLMYFIFFTPHAPLGLLITFENFWNPLILAFKANSPPYSKLTFFRILEHCDTLLKPENDSPLNIYEWICILAAYQVRNLQMDTYAFVYGKPKCKIKDVEY